METHPRILTIAGSDSGGGAGIQADLKTFTVLGSYGMSVITALTAQNTREVTGIEACTPEFAARQLAAILDDIPPDAAKTGMLFSSPIIEALAPLLRDRAFPLVVDPVCVATSGARLLEESAVRAMAEELFPLADLVTPNISEAEVFSGMDISESEHIITALERILALGPGAVLIKGGHFGSAALTDWLGLRGEKPLPLMHPRVETANLHGTGCTLSAAIAEGLGRGLDMISSVVRAQRFLNLGLRASFNPGGGNGPVNHLARLEKLEALRDVPDRLEGLVEEFGRIPGFAGLVPEDGLEPVLALPHADAPEDIAGYGGCVVADCRGRLAVSGRPVFGASPRMGAALLAARRVRSEFSCAACLRTGKNVEKAAARAGLTVAWFDRSDYPDADARERDILEWGVRQAFSEHPEPAEIDAVCDWGAQGKPPRLRIFARDVEELASMAARLAKGVK